MGLWKLDDIAAATDSRLVKPGDNAILRMEDGKLPLRHFWPRILEKPAH